MFFCNATGKADCSKAGIGSILRWAMGLADWAALRDIKTVSKSYRHQRFGHGGAVVVAGDADETGDFLLFQFSNRSEHAGGAADALEVVEIGQAVDLNQIDIVGLQKLETGFHRAQARRRDRADRSWWRERFLCGAFWQTRRGVFRSSRSIPRRV